MGRSVSYANGSIAVAYQSPSFEWIDEDTGESHYDYFMWDDYKSGLKYQIKNLFPSMSGCDEWVGREDLAIMENRHAYIGISEYCGMVSVWLLPKEHDDQRDYNIAVAWCNQVKTKFLKQFGDLIKVGSFSNGEGVFEKRKVA